MIASFVLKLLAGITTTWLLMPRRDVADGFFRIQMLVVLGLAVLLVLAFDPVALAGPPQIPDGVAATSPQAASAIASQQELSGLPTAVRWLRGGRHSPSLFWPTLATFFGSSDAAPPARSASSPSDCLASLPSHFSPYSSPQGTPIVLQLLADSSSAMVLGGVLTGMLLGHWYLTSPGMSLKPLLWFCPVLAGAATARLAATGLAIATSGLPPSDLVRMIWLALQNSWRHSRSRRRSSACSPDSALSQYAVCHRSALRGADFGVYGRNVRCPSRTRSRGSLLTCIPADTQDSQVAPASSAWWPDSPGPCFCGRWIL
ncbi:MAG UNVERIFIED_CONTAM: hypothetical protein LVR18_15665 [Planctomycetaceae bacterium]|jgi:hypothetical protein